MSVVNWSLAIVADSAQVLLTTNPVLLEGQVGIENDSQLFKVGDGITAWVDLAYATINNQQSVWVGVSSDDGNLLERSTEDGGLLLRKAIFLSATEHIDALNSNTALNAMDVSDPMKAPVYRLTVLLRSVIAALGSDFADLKTATYSGASIQDRITEVMDIAQLIQSMVNDNAISLTTTWSSSYINQMITTAVNSAVAGLVGASPEALNTIYEIAAALETNQGLVTTIMSELGNTVRFTEQALTTEQKLQARINIGAASSTLLGDYSEIGNKTLMDHYLEALGEQAPVTEVTVADVLPRLLDLEIRAQMALCSTVKSAYDGNIGQYTVISWVRSDTTTAATSSLSNPSTDGLYQTRTERYFAADGTTLLRTAVFYLTYDNNGAVVNESIVSII